MKFFAVFALLIVAAQATPFLTPVMEPGLVNAETHEEFLKQLETTGAKVGEKIASGVEAKKGEFPEFCYLTIQFYEKAKSCGCWIYSSKIIMTSARCVADCSEGEASNVTVTIPALSGKDAVFKAVKFEFLTGFTPSTSYTNIEERNFAVVTLENEIPAAKFGDGKDARAAKIELFSDADAAAFVLRLKDFKFRACGVGVIGNKGERAKGVVCTDVNIITDPTMCKEPYAATPFTIPAASFCLEWPDRDNNVCVGDFGGPVYAYKLDAKGAVDPKTQSVICTLTGSPNVRKNAPCLDGHITFCFSTPD